MTTDTPSPRRKWHLQRWLLLLAAGFLAYGGWTTYAFRAALKEARALGWYVEYTDPSEEIRADWKAAFKKETWLDGVTLVGTPRGDAFDQHLAIVYRLNPKRLQIGDGFTLRDLSALKPLTRLREVSLEDCSGLTNMDGLKNLPALQVVWLQGPIGFTNVEGLKNLSALEEVTLYNFTELTNVDALKNLSALRRVCLDSCTGLTNVDALKDLSSLTDVYLIGCTGLTNVDGLNNLSALQWVWLDLCTGLTPESVAALKAALPNATISGP